MILDRVGEAYLCQFPDGRCDEERYMGTGYCSAHLSVMRVRCSAGKFGEVSARAAQQEENALATQRADSSFVSSDEDAA